MTLTLALAATAALPALLASRPPVPAIGAAARFDAFGDPLPAGAVARAGTVRFRHGGEVQQIAFAPDGKTIYSACPKDKAVRAWEAASGREFQRFESNASVQSVAISPDGRTLATIDEANTLRLWDAAAGRELHALTPTPGAARGPGFLRMNRVAGFTPDGKMVVALHAPDNAVIVWNVAEGREVRRLAEAGTNTTAVTMSADGSTLATAHASNHIRIWDLATGRQRHQLAGHRDAPTGLALSPDGKTLASTAAEPIVRVWDTAAGRELRQVQILGLPTAIAFAPDGKAVTVAYDTDEQAGTVQLFDPATGQEIRRLDGYIRGTLALTFSTDGTTLAAAGEGNTIRLWDVATGREVRPTAGHPGPVTTVVLSPDGKLLATCSSFDKVIRLWDTASGREVRRLEGHPTGVDEVVFSPDGRLLASGAWDQPVYLWDVTTGQLLRRLADHPSLGPHLRFADDSRTLATAGRHPVAAVWDVATGRPLQQYPLPAHGIAGLLSFRGGRLLAVERNDQDDEGETPIILWDVAANRVLRRFTSHRGIVNSVVLSPDGRSLASRGEDHTIRVWELASGQERCQLHDAGASPGWTGTQFLAFAPDGRVLVTAATVDPVARRWDLSNGQQLPPLAGHRGWIGALDYSADGRLLVTASQDTTCLIWVMAAPARQAQRPPAQRPDDELNTLWNDLRDANAAKAYRALWALAATGDQAVALAARRLQAAPPVDRQSLSRWVGELDHPQFAVRERATTALMQVADQAESLLAGILETTRSAEVRQRVRRILDAAHQADASPERLREVRAVELLELLATPAARRLLADLGRGAAGAELTRQAQAALGRLERRAGPG